MPDSGELLLEYGVNVRMKEGERSYNISAEIPQGSILSPVLRNAAYDGFCIEAQTSTGRKTGRFFRLIYPCDIRRADRGIGTDSSACSGHNRKLDEQLSKQRALAQHKTVVNTRVEDV